MKNTICCKYTEEELSLIDIDHIIDKFLTKYPDYKLSHNEIKQLIITNRELADIEVKFAYNNIYARTWMTYKNFTPWEQITDIPYVKRTDIPFESFPNYSYDMYDGKVPARHGKYHPDTNNLDITKDTDIYQSRYGDTEIIPETGEVIHGSVDVIGKDVNIFILGDRMWVIKIPYSATGTPTQWHTNNAEDMSISIKQQPMVSGSAFMYINKLDDSIEQLRVFKKRALELYLASK